MLKQLLPILVINTWTTSVYLFIRPVVLTTELPFMMSLRKVLKLVTPEGSWPLTLIGHFPKKQFESEREREWRLNTEVRLPLKTEIEGLLSYKPSQQIDSA